MKLDKVVEVPEYHGKYFFVSNGDKSVYWLQANDSGADTAERFWNRAHKILS